MARPVIVTGAPGCGVQLVAAALKACQYPASVMKIGWAGGHRHAIRGVIDDAMARKGIDTTNGAFGITDNQCFAEYEWDKDEAVELRKRCCVRDGDVMADVLACRCWPLLDRAWPDALWVLVDRHMVDAVSAVLADPTVSLIAPYAERCVRAHRMLADDIYRSCSAAMRFDTSGLWPNGSLEARIGGAQSLLNIVAQADVAAMPYRWREVQLMEAIREENVKVEML